MRLLLTAFLALIAIGYLIAVANIFERHGMADGKAGLSLDDIRAVYAGLRTADASRGEAASRMLTMIRGEMREYLSSDSDFGVLESWLKAGGAQAGLDQGSARHTPRKIIVNDCLRCHAKSTDTEISKESSFGPDEFTVDYDSISRFATGKAKPGSDRAAPQYTLPRLILVSHQHMLSIPVFTLIVGAIFAFARFPRRLRAIITPLPMLCVLVDFGGWWLARISDAGVLAVAAGGAVFGLAFGLQILVVLIDLWRPVMTDDAACESP